MSFSVLNSNGFILNGKSVQNNFNSLKLVEISHQWSNHVFAAEDTTSLSWASSLERESGSCMLQPLPRRRTTRGDFAWYQHHIVRMASVQHLMIIFSHKKILFNAKTLMCMHAHSNHQVPLQRKEAKQRLRNQSGTTSDFFPTNLNEFMGR